MLANNGKHLSYVSVVVIPNSADESKCTPICTCESNRLVNRYLLKTLHRYSILTELDWDDENFKKEMASAYEEHEDRFDSPCIHAQ